MDSNLPNVLAVDLGEKRIGLARGITSARFASPLTTIDNGPDVFERLAAIVADEQIGLIVVGRPINSAGEATAQTKYTADFIENLQQHIKTPIVWQDETLTSVKAEQELSSRAKPYQKGEVDALAATYILEDYFETIGSRASGVQNA